MASDWATLALIVLIVFILSYLGSTGMCRLAQYYGWMALPRQDRWHSTATAFHGGVGFYPSFVLGVLWIFLKTFTLEEITRGLDGSFSSGFILLLALLIGSLLTFLLGLFDDIKNFRPATKVLGELMAASFFIAAGGVFPLTTHYPINILVTLFWFVGVMNAVNMLDNMDGLSSGVVIIASLTIVALTCISPHEGSCLEILAVPVGLVFVASLLGFWGHNKPPAKIFMGDSGSLFIGYVLAALAVPSPLNGYIGLFPKNVFMGPLLVLIIPASVVAIPIFDTTLVTITRAWRAQNPMQGGRDHSSHRLVGLGLSETRTIWTLYMFAAFGGTIALLLQSYPQQALPLLVIYSLVIIFAGIYLGRVKLKEIKPQDQKSGWTPLVASLLYKRHVAEVLLDTVIVILCFYGAYLLRFDGVLAEAVVAAIKTALPIMILSCLFSFFLVGIYRGQWNLISLSEIPRYALGVLLGTILGLAMVVMITRFHGAHSRGAFIIFAFLLFLGQTGSRSSFRLLDYYISKRKIREPSLKETQVLIYGAGKAGKILYEEILFNPQFSEYVVIGFIDDDFKKAGQTLSSLPIRQATYWLRNMGNRNIEIWVSSQYVEDARVAEVARDWKDKATVKRLRIHMETVTADRGNTDK